MRYRILSKPCGKLARKTLSIKFLENLSFESWLLERVMRASAETCPNPIAQSEEKLMEIPWCLRVLVPKNSRILVKTNTE